MRDDRMFRSTRVPYVTTPVLVPLAWWRDRATEAATPEPGEPPLPRIVRPLLHADGAVRSLVALVVLLSRPGRRPTGIAAAP